MTTKLLYLNDTYLYKSTAKVLDIIENEYGTALVLDQTIFYPEGGGQPSDFGSIDLDDTKFEVDNVRLSRDGIVLHYGSIKSDFSKFKNQNVVLQIDSERRLTNSKFHSAGHLIDVAVYTLRIKELSPSKGFHDQKGAYAQFDGVLENTSSYIEALEIELDRLIEEDLKIEIMDLSPEEAKKRNIYAPEGKSARFVYYEGYKIIGSGCGGTHIVKTSEIGPITIQKIKSTKGVTRISYQITE